VKVLYGSWKEHLSSSGKSSTDPMVMPWLFSKPFRKQHPEKVREIKASFAGHFQNLSESNILKKYGKLRQVSPGNIFPAKAVRLRDN
jgi:hypothetical protein